MAHYAAAKVKTEREPEDDGHMFSPETKALLKGLGDSPESMQLKAEILSAANELKRGVDYQILMCVSENYFHNIMIYVSYYVNIVYDTRQSIQTYTTIFSASF